MGTLSKENVVNEETDVGSETTNQKPDDRLVIVDDNDQLMEDAFRQAKATLADYLLFFKNAPEYTSNHRVKALFQDDNGGEYIWLDDISRKGNSIFGKVVDAPNIVSYVSHGEIVSVPLKHVTDWAFKADGEQYGNYTGYALLKNMSPKEVKSYVDVEGFTKNPLETPDASFSEIIASLPITTPKFLDNDTMKNIITKAQKYMDQKKYEEGYLTYRNDLAAVKLDKENYDSLYYYYGYLFALINRIDSIEGDAKIETMKEYIACGQTLLDTISGPILFQYSGLGKFKREIRRNASNGIGWYLMELGQLEEALPYAETAVSMIDSDADDYTFETLVYILIKLGRKDEAYRIIKRTLDKKPRYRYFQVFLTDEDYLAWKEVNFPDVPKKLKNIRAVVENFNQYVMGLDGTVNPEKCCSPIFEFKKTATTQEIEQLQEAFEIPMPADLVKFYKTLGCISPYEVYYCEDHYLKIFSAQSMLKSINKDAGGECKSFGLVDMIVDHWGQERHEFIDDLEDNEKEKFKHINDRFKCIGEYALDWGLEESYYIYFAENGKFGAIRYHQDEYDEVIEEFDNMLKRKGPTLSLREVIEKGLNEIKEVI